MARQPLLPVYRNATCTMGPQQIEARPEHVAIIGKCMTYWPEVLHQQALLLGLFLGVRSEGALAVFSTLQNAAARRAAIFAAADLSLKTEKDLDLLSAVMNIIGSAEKERNDLAHGCFGISKDIPDGILWIASKDIGTWQASIIFKPSAAASDGDYTKLANLLYVYKKQDLERIYDQIAETWGIIHHLLIYVDERQRAAETLSPVSDRLYDLLIAAPRVGEALAQIAEGKKKQQPQS